MSYEDCIGQPFYPPGNIFNDQTSADSAVCHDSLNRGVLVPYFLVGALINFLNLVLFFLNHGKERQNTSARLPYALVMTLCFTDITFLLAGQMVWAISYFRETPFPGSGYPYIISLFFLSACLRFSRYVVVGMSIERFISIKKAFIYEDVVTFPRVASAAAFILSYSVGIAALELVSLRVNQTSCPDSENIHWHDLCGATSPVGVFAASLIHALNVWSLIENFILGGILLSCNFVVYRCMSKMRARINVVCPRSREEYRRMVDMIKGVPAEFSRLMAAIAVVYAFTVFPYGVRVICNILGVWPSSSLDYIAVQLYISPPILNPLLYGLFRRKFRERFFRLIRRFTRCVSNKIRPIESSTATRTDQCGSEDGS